MLKDKCSRLQMLEEQAANQDDVLKVEVNKLREALVNCEGSHNAASPAKSSTSGKGKPAASSLSASEKGCPGATVALTLLKERADLAEARAASATGQIAELKACLQVNQGPVVTDVTVHYCLLLISVTMSH
ncbi:hypothetical protein ABBQ38_006466 [Trebouxia sp. C0009 RCD-2024]